MIEISFASMLRIMSAGALETLKLLPFCIAFSLIGGVVLGIIQSSRVPIVNQIIALYVLIMRGIPPLIILFLVFFTANLDSGVVSAILALSLYHVAYVTEIVRGGISSISRGQFEAGRSLGLRNTQVMHRVIIPQIWRGILPALAGQYIILVKDTALVSVVGVREILWSGRQIMQLTYDPFPIYLLIGVFFYVICFLLERLSVFAERRARAFASISGGRNR